MDKKTFIGLLDTQVEAIGNAPPGKSENESLLKTIKLLMERLDYSGSVLSGYERLELRKLFASFGAIGQAACDFYDASKPYLDPTALQGEIGQKLENAKTEITRVNSLMEAIRQENANLHQQEEELAKKHDTYTKLEQKIAEIEHYKALYKTLDNDMKETTAIHSIYALHLGENSELARKMQEHGIVSSGDLASEIRKLEISIKQELTRFDNVLKDVIAQKEKMKDEIEAMQGGR
ncbi:MAG: hypothetical protein FWC77_06440 [Defluviitaleaceae bacterium]|nr:hypothetical protein [Defluviitaleaceae bacterium]